MAWVDQRDVAKQHLALATVALERAASGTAVSPDVLEALTELKAVSAALAKISEDGPDEDEPTTR
jgi:hypothetical protein